MTDNELLLSMSDLLDKKLTPINERITNIEVKVNNMDQKFDNMELKVDNMELKVNKIELTTKKVELTLENETNRNIQIIAEGHLNLSRKLDDALKVENEREMLLIRLNRLENEMRLVKERLNEIA